MRLFIAVNLPDDVRARIHAGAEPLRSRDLPVRWVAPEHYHVTLKFLGEVHPDRLPRVRQVLDRVGSQTRTFPLELKGFGAFPTLRRPRVLWVGIDPSPALRCLKQDLEWGLAELGFARETRAFHPHLTLGRADEDAGAGPFRGLDAVDDVLPEAVRVPLEGLDLMRSQLARTGPRYTVLSSSGLSQQP